VLAVRREHYDSVGGHAHPAVRQAHTEDIALARVCGGAELFTGRPDTSFRMYPGGLRQSISGWGRSMASGARSVRWWAMLAVIAWLWSLAGGWLAEPIVYPLSAVQVWVLGRRAGSIHPLTALLYPLAVVALVLVVARSALAWLLDRDIEWKGRRVASRSG
jgi:hypothetical protein